MEYHVIEETHREVLSQKVSEYHEEGWELHGDLIVVAASYNSPLQYIQAMKRSDLCIKRG